MSSRILVCIFLLCATQHQTARAADSESRRLMKERRHEIFSRTLRQDGGLVHGVIHPRRVSRRGDHVEFASLDALSELAHDGTLRRRAEMTSRSAAERLAPRDLAADGNHMVFYHLGSSSTALDGARLKLRRNYQLVSGDFVVEERGVDGKVKSRHGRVHDCHYTGTIDNHHGFSRVAMSLCNGLQGIIHKDNETYFIEPQWNHTSKFEPHQDAEAHPHYVTKRSVSGDYEKRAKDADPKDIHRCGVQDDSEKPFWKRRSKRSSSSQEQEQEVKEEAHSRRKRAISVERNVETLLVADKVLMRTHGRDELQKYLLTIMNMVRSLYHDATIGNSINIVVTRMILLAEDQPDLKMSFMADTMLTNFCGWQANLVEDDTDNKVDLGLSRHDNAIFITGINFCVTANACGAVGYAPVGGICDPQRSCNINEDQGIATAHTIAHEIGHNFGMQHDSVMNDCGTPNGDAAKIMAPVSAMSTNPFQWSQCSRKYITDYLDSGNGACLLDSPPQRNFQYSDELPGQIYDVDEQCRFMFGPSSRECSYGKTCSKLWCLVNMTDTGIVNGCITHSVPAAEGTNCTSDTIEFGWCNRGECVEFGYLPKSRDGAWGAWSSWAECSRTCGTGVAMSQRSCSQPAPENGGRYCIGRRKRYMTCNTDPCPPNSKDFRSMQCEVFDHEAFRGRYYNWYPFHVDRHEKNPCALNCIAGGQKFYSQKSKMVIDGTRCFPESLDLCISGECHHVGCDNVLHSDAVEDKCRVCGGDGSSCVTHAGVYTNSEGYGQYSKVVTIPKGSVNIFIEEVTYSQANFIAVRGTDSENYLNANWAIEWPRSMDVAGTTLVYKRPVDEPESLRARGPINIDLDILVLLIEPNVGIKYEYNVPVEGSDIASGMIPESIFLWEYDDWGPCTATCAGGVQTKAVLCKRFDDDTVVQHSYCDQRTMPLEEQRTCNVGPCPATWFVGRWEECSATCGGGVRSRLVMCMRTISQTEDETVPDHFCVEAKPDHETPCNSEECPPEWVAIKWGKCSVTCGSGMKTRDVLCMSQDRETTYPTSRCDSRQKPVERTQCDMIPCPPFRWITGKFSQCSTGCGHGHKKRRVWCVQGKKKVPDRKCPSPKPPATISCRSHRRCNTPTSQDTSSSSSSSSDSSGNAQCIDDPKVVYCPKVVRYSFCSRVYFRKTCCRSCSQNR